MKAVWYERNGPANEVLTVGEMPTPTPAAGEVLVKLHASGVNPSDVKSRAGRPLAFERIVPHSDGAGVIEAVGKGVDTKRIGQRVWIWNGQWQRAMGTCAQYIALPDQQAVLLPDQVSFEAGACLGIPALTAWQAIAHAGNLKDKTVVVIGAANAVGAYCVQMAKLAGGRVIGTVGSSAKGELATRLGADAIVNYKTGDTAKGLLELTNNEGADVMIDMDFSSIDQLVKGGALKAHGMVISYGSNGMGNVTFDFRSWLFRSVAVKLFLVYDLTLDQRRAALNGLNEMLQHNKLTHMIGKHYDLVDAAAAHEAVQNGSVVGNVVITI